MSENDNKKIEDPIEKVEEVQEVKNAEEVVEKVEEVKKEDEVEKVEAVDEENKIGFIDNLKAGIIDQVVIGVISFVALYLVDGILKLLAGLYIADKTAVYLVIYVIISIIYPAVMNASKFGNTVGRKSSNVKLMKIK